MRKGKDAGSFFILALMCLKNVKVCAMLHYNRIHIKIHYDHYIKTSLENLTQTRRPF